MAKHEPRRRAKFAADLFLELGAWGPQSMRIESALRDAIRSGRLGEGARLPSTRVLAAEIGVSRNSVVAAYSQLSAEGWIVGRRGGGTVVAVAPAQTLGEQAPPRPLRKAGVSFDFSPSEPNPGSFPRHEWLRALRRVLAQTPDASLGYGDPAGHADLRHELAVYLRRARGLAVAPENLVVTTGFSQGLSLLLRALAHNGVTKVAVEHPCVPGHRALIRRVGHELVLLDVDEHGARVAELAESGVGAVLLTPNRQHPLGVQLSPRRRASLLDWARTCGALVIENDYDGEFRYDGHRISPLQALDPSAVAYGGTIAKTLGAAARVGWLALPTSWMEPLITEKWYADLQTSVLEQLALTELLRSGAYDRHIRKMRGVHRQRRDLLLELLATKVPVLQPSGIAAGLSVVVEVCDIETEAAVLAAARDRGIALRGLSQGNYYERDAKAGIVIGYAAAPDHSYAAGVEALALVLAAAV
jgi:GntR family transcriptional regulator / MocR family aminotransferase